MFGITTQYKMTLFKAPNRKFAFIWHFNNEIELKNVNRAFLVTFGLVYKAHGFISIRKCPT